MRQYPRSGLCLTLADTILGLKFNKQKLYVGNFLQGPRLALTQEVLEIRGIYEVEERSTKTQFLELRLWLPTPEDDPLISECLASPRYALVEPILLRYMTLAQIRAWV